jgi:hypothetical protein
MVDYVLNDAVETEVEAAESEAVHAGPLVAATLAPLLGFFTLMVTHHISRLTKGLDQLVHSFGYWIPGSTGSGPDGSIGSYSGKETLALLVWLVSWLVFHLLWKRQDFVIVRWLPVFVGILAFIVIGFFHPLADPIVLAVASALGVI